MLNTHTQYHWHPYQERKPRKANTKTQAYDALIKRIDSEFASGKYWLELKAEDVAHFNAMSLSHFVRNFQSVLRCEKTTRRTRRNWLFQVVDNSIFVRIPKPKFTE